MLRIGLASPVINGEVVNAYSHLHRSLRVLRSGAPNPQATDHLSTVRAWTLMDVDRGMERSRKCVNCVLN